ncbi:hypothetical protein [Brevundimonas sp.]|jgi:hypothetical protein|uniref:hypothetical protein n=1 Tax=Brevundimonas sp. TaxID=1871086 RepID=UPI00184B74B9|nr:hypothetical protein [Brevundimonas sp.]MBA4806740.1 hypothetical protein [Brevundimonas sp.]
MPKAFMTRGLSIAALAAAALLASCSTKEPEAPPPPPPPPPPVTLNEGVAQAASIYVAFLREAETIQPGGFPDAESIQAAIRKGASYEPAQLSRGLIAYGSIIALQSPEFVAGVRQFAVDPAQRQEMVARIVADPAYAATLPGADAAAGLIAATIGKDATAIRAIAEAVEADAYTVQERNDPRRRWATTHITNREVRLEGAKTLSAATMLPSAEESSRLFTAANTGQGLDVETSRKAPPYTPAVTRSLAIAALASLGAAGDDARANTDALVVEANNEFCLNMSKLMLFQCLAASRPSYEDMFCLGRHIARDLATCTTQAVVSPQVSVGDLLDAGAEPPERLTQTPVQVTLSSPTTPTPAPSR